MSKVIHGIIILCILALLYFWIVPWKKKEINFQGVLDQKNTTNVIRETADLVSPSVSPERVALLFGWKRKPAARPVTEILVEEEPPIEEKVVLATWLRPLGYAIGSDGKKYFFFKDEKSNKVLQLTDDNVDSGWKILDVSDAEFLLEYEGKKYSVSSK